MQLDKNRLLDFGKHGRTKVTKGPAGSVFFLMDGGHRAVMGSQTQMLTGSGQVTLRMARYRSQVALLVNLGFPIFGVYMRARNT